MALELVENSSLLSFSLAWTKGLLTVRTTIRWEDWMIWTCLMICLIAIAMARALISHGSQVTWCLHSFTAKNPANSSWSFGVHTVWLRCLCCSLTESLIKIHKASLVLWPSKACLAVLKARGSLQQHTSLSLDSVPPGAWSRGSSSSLYLGST